MSQTPTDTFYYGGTVVGPGGEPFAAEPAAPGWGNRKMWTWNPGGFNGTPHSGLDMDGWVGLDQNASSATYFRVMDNATIGSACVLAGAKSLACCATNQECVQLCFAEFSGAGYGNGWRQAVVTPGYAYAPGTQVTLSYGYSNATEPEFDYTYVIVQVYDAGAWEDYDTVAVYDGASAGTEAVDVDSHLSALGKSISFRFVFRFDSDGGYSNQDGMYPTNCGAFVLDAYSLDNNGVVYSEDFEGVEVGQLPAGWSELVGGCGDYAAVKHLNGLSFPVTLDPCILETPELCSVADSVLVLFDSANPSYPHPLCQDNVAISPAIDLSGHPTMPGRLFCWERFAHSP